MLQLLCTRHLSEEIRAEYTERAIKEITMEQLIGLAMEIVPYDMRHNAETDACDLLMEIEELDKLEQHTDESNFQRVCLYLTR